MPYNSPFLKVILFVWLCWVFVAARTFSSCGEQGLYSSYRGRVSHRSGFSCSRAGALGAHASIVTVCGPSRCSSWALGHRLSSRGSRLSCSLACGIFLDQGLNLCLLHWEVGSYPLYHQGSPCSTVILNPFCLLSPLLPLSSIRSSYTW